MGILGRGVGNQVCDQLDHILIRADILKRIVTVGLIHVDKVKHNDPVTLVF